MIPQIAQAARELKRMNTWRERQEVLVSVELPLREAIGAQRARLVVRFDRKNREIHVAREIWDSASDDWLIPAYGAMSFDLKEFYVAAQAIAKARSLLNVL